MAPDVADQMLRVGALAAGAASGAAAGVASSWSMMVFHVDLAVVFAAFSGALVSLSFLPAASLTRTLAIMWSGTVAGSYTSPLVAAKMGVQHDMTVGVAFIIAAAFQWLAPVIIRRITGAK